MLTEHPTAALRLMSERPSCYQPPHPQVRIEEDPSEHDGHRQCRIAPDIGESDRTLLTRYFIESMEITFRSLRSAPLDLRL